MRAILSFAVHPTRPSPTPPHPSPSPLPPSPIFRPVPFPPDTTRCVPFSPLFPSPPRPTVSPLTYVRALLAPQASCRGLWQGTVHLIGRLWSARPGTRARGPGPVAQDQAPGPGAPGPGLSGQLCRDPPCDPLQLRPSMTATGYGRVPQVFADGQFRPRKSTCGGFATATKYVYFGRGMPSEVSLDPAPPPTTTTTTITGK